MDEFIYIEVGYKRIVNVGGIKTVTSKDRFEIICEPHTDIWEQQAVQMLREWVRERKAQLRSSGDLSE